MNMHNRVEKLEKIQAAAEPTEIKVNVWWDDKTVIDEETGREMTKEEYYEKYKDDPNHIFVGWNDIQDND